MIPFSKLPPEAQKSILILVALSSSASLASCCGPIICDPVPPPRTATMTPMICDPAPPPSVRAGPTMTPMICDPAPPPSVVRPNALGFRVKSLEVNQDASVAIAAVRGRVVDQTGRPLAGVKVYVTDPQFNQPFTTDENGEIYAQVPAAGVYAVTTLGGGTGRVLVDLELHEVATIEWESVPLTPAPPNTEATPTPMIFDPAPFPSSQPSSSTHSDDLPLAEIRTVEIVWAGGLTFHAQTPWAGARYHWSVSGGTLEESEARVMWQPPAEAGRYLVQVVADWGQRGLAVDSIVLAVLDDGTVLFG